MSVIEVNDMPIIPVIPIASSMHAYDETKIIYLSDQNITDINIETYLQHYLLNSMVSTLLSNNFHTIYLHNNEISTSFEKLFKLLNLKSIKIISLYNNKLDDEGTILLAKYLSNHGLCSDTNYLENLEYLDISENCIGCEGTKALADALKTHKYLNQLDISCNNICAEGANYIGEMLQINKSITDLNIDNNNINFSEAIIFASSISSNTSLTNLDIGCNEFDISEDTPVSNYKKLEEVIKFILSSKTITNLICYSCDIDDIMMEYFSNGLKQNSVLEEIQLYYNEISNEGAYLLFDALKTNDKTVLKYIDLSNSYINNDCITSFAELIGNNDVLQTVNMCDTDINNEGLIVLSKRPELQKNKSLIQIKYGPEDIHMDIDEPIKNTEISLILESNKNLFWYPYAHSCNLFNNCSNQMNNYLITTLLFVMYGNLKVILPTDVILYIFKFFNRNNFLPISN